MTDAQQEAQFLMAQPDTSRWLKNSLKTALDRDPVDAFHDAQVLCRIMSTNAAEVLEQALCQLPRESRTNQTQESLQLTSHSNEQG